MMLTSFQWVTSPTAMGGVVTDGLAVGPPFSGGHTLVNKNGITVIHKHFGLGGRLARGLY